MKRMVDTELGSNARSDSSKAKVTKRVKLETVGNESWDFVIEPQNSWFDLKLREIIRYKDLLLLFVKRDVVTVYKQTILGPLWYIIQPVLTTIMFTVIFGNVAQISTDGVPAILFYMSGVTFWNYFADCFRMTSDVFTKNQNIFGKVYFPRAVVPLSITLSNLIKFGIQLLLFLAVWLYYFYFRNSSIQIQAEIILFPLLVSLMATLALGFGMIISSLTSKYRDLTLLIQFGIQLFMYATPIVYPASIVTGRFKYLLWFNPMTSIVEAFKYMFLGQGQLDWFWLTYSFFFSAIIFVLGLSFFNRTEKNFMDTV